MSVTIIYLLIRPVGHVYRLFGLNGILKAGDGCSV